MKIVWTIANPVGAMYNAITGKKLYSSGGWIGDLLDELKKAKLNSEISIISIGDIGDDQWHSLDGVMYYCFKGNSLSNVRSINDTIVKQFRTILNEIKPDIVHIFGTETLFTSHMVKAIENKYAYVIQIQGIISEINKYEFGNISKYDLYGKGILQRIVGEVWRKRNINTQASEEEKKVLKECSAIICDNQWAYDICKFYNPKVKMYNIPLATNIVFQRSEWRIEKCQKHRIFTVGENNGFKGLHMLIKAAAPLIDRYPDLKIVVPGRFYDMKAFKSIKTNPYQRYLFTIVDENKMMNHIEFLGAISPRSMADEMVKANLFVSASVIESNAQTLREAMNVGTPSISSNVGAVSEYINSGYNGMLYRYEELERLSTQIATIFENDDLACELSKNARESIRMKYPQGESIGDRLVEAYEKIIRLFCTIDSTNSVTDN